MRVKTKNLEDRNGEFRVASKFLLFPKCLDKEWRWWERVFVVQKVVGWDVGGSGEWGRYKYAWSDQHWLDSKEACLKVYKDMLKA